MDENEGSNGRVIGSTVVANALMSIDHSLKQLLGELQKQGAGQDHHAHQSASDLRRLIIHGERVVEKLDAILEVSEETREHTDPGKQKTFADRTVRELVIIVANGSKAAWKLWPALATIGAGGALWKAIELLKGPQQ